MRRLLPSTSCLRCNKQVGAEFILVLQAVTAALDRNAGKSHNAGTAAGYTSLPMPALLPRHALSRNSFGNCCWPCTPKRLQMSIPGAGMQKRVDFIVDMLVVSRRPCLK